MRFASLKEAFVTETTSHLPRRFLGRALSRALSFLPAFFERETLQISPRLLPDDPSTQTWDSDASRTTTDVTAIAVYLPKRIAYIQVISLPFVDRCQKNQVRATLKLKDKGALVDWPAVSTYRLPIGVCKGLRELNQVVRVRYDFTKVVRCKLIRQNFDGDQLISKYPLRLLFENGCVSATSTCNDRSSENEPETGANNKANIHYVLRHNHT